MRLTMRRISEVNTIPDIRERNDRPKDKQPKHHVTSTVQRQMVQKFVKELNEEMLQIYLSLTYVAGEDTFFRGLKKDGLPQSVFFLLKYLG